MGRSASSSREAAVRLSVDDPHYPYRSSIDAIRSRRLSSLADFAFRDEFPGDAIGLVRCRRDHVRGSGKLGLTRTGDVVDGEITFELRRS